MVSAPAAEGLVSDERKSGRSAPEPKPETALTGGFRSGPTSGITNLLLEVENLTVRYGDSSSYAVSDVSLAVERGEIYGLVGESGSGKSTIASALLGLTSRKGHILSGRVKLNGRNLLGLPDRQKRKIRGSEIGYVGQNPFGALHPILSVSAQFEQRRRAHSPGFSKREGQSRAASLLSEFGIPDPNSVMAGYAHQLSGGMAQRVVIALAFFLRPQLLVADEPTTGLDLSVTRQIMDLVVDSAVRHGTGLFLVTHDLGLVAQYCDRVGVLYGGQIVETGPVLDVFTKPLHPYTEALISSVPVRGRELQILPSSTLQASGDGCPFRLRCRYAAPECSSPPPLFSATPLWHGRCIRSEARYTAWHS
jgi:peptide/nickel transport system ATP-binding protein